MDHPLIRINGLTKRYNSVPAVDRVSLTVNKGVSYALVGKNGAGKTTLLKMLVGLTRPDFGSAEIMGHDIARDPVRAKSAFGYLSDNPSGYEYLTGTEFLEFTGSLRGMSRDDIAKRLAKLSIIFPMDGILAQQISSYSRGNRQKVGILAAVMTRPDVLIIDEPIVGLDPESIGILGRLITSHCRSGGAVLFVTHILPFAAEYADTVGIMDRGILRDEQPVTGKRLPPEIVRGVEASV